jgi:DNA-binding PadR family transcriptional regulator
MRLKPTAYLILGMLNRGVETGYSIKRTVNLSTRFFWAASLAQVYTELAALKNDGYIVGADEPHGARPRKTYSLTEKGRAALGEWLRSDRPPDLELRDEGLLRLFFADAIPFDEALVLVRTLRIRAEEMDRSFRSEILPRAEVATGRFPLIAARKRADYFAWRAAWFRDLEQELRDEPPCPPMLTDSR